MSDCMSREEAIQHLEEMKKGIFLWDMSELIDLCISALSENKGDTVSREAYEQIKWERDTAIQQLKDLGYGLGEEPKEKGVSK